MAACAPAKVPNAPSPIPVTFDVCPLVLDVACRKSALPLTVTMYTLNDPLDASYSHSV